MELLVLAMLETIELLIIGPFSSLRNTNQKHQQ